MADQWYFDLGEDEQGPISSGELRQLVADQTINSETLVWKEGMEDWVPASRIKGLFSEKSSSASSPRRKAAPAPSSQGGEKAYCRACGNEVGVEAVACLSCGLEPTNGSDFCGSCGADTNSKAVLCISCGVSLESSRGTKISSTRRSGRGTGSSSEDPAAMESFLGSLPGSKRTYYEENFEKIIENGGNFTATWNWSAFVCGCFWYFHHGMWQKGLAIVAVALFTVVGAIPIWVYCGIAGNVDLYRLKVQDRHW